MGQQQSTFQPPSSRNYEVKSTNLLKIEHEGILKLRSTPFPNCIQIQTKNEILFLQNAQMSLNDLLQNRFYTNRLFLMEDIEKLIQGISYTLAFLEQNNIVYKDLTSENIYYTNGNFKLLPNELIDISTYERALDYTADKRRRYQEQEQIQFPCLSPELVIALRYKETRIDDFELQQKSNVFLLGLVLLEATTLMPSKECYDQETYDIFNSVISERLSIIEDHYNQKIARIIANMLDYDYAERMSPKEISIWINRQLIVEREDTTNNSVFNSDKYKMKTSMSKSTLKKSGLRSNASEKQLEQSRPKKSYGKNNNIYINGDYVDSEQVDDGCSDLALQYKGSAKNQIYLDERYEAKDPFILEHKGKLQTINSNLQYQNSRSNHQYRIQKVGKKPYIQNLERTSYVEPEKPNYTRSEKMIFEDHTFSDLGNHRRSAYDLPTTNNRQEQIHERREEIYDQGFQKSKLEKLEKLEKNPYYQPPQKKSEVEPLKINSMNKYFPNLEELDKNNKPTETKRVAKHAQVGKNVKNREIYDFKSFDSKGIEDSSINKIKLEIEKSRKLIEEFRRSEGLAQN